jgi:hypothetical protein
MVKKYTLTEIEYVKLNYGQKSYLEMEKDSGIPIGRLKSIVYKYIPHRFKTGKSPFSSSDERLHQINDNSFENYSLESCYWAGFLASDGNINKTRKVITLFLQEQDLSVIEKFKKYLGFSGKICETNYKYEYKGLTSIKKSFGIVFTSKKIAFDLEKNFNITPKKSLTLEPPELTKKQFIDAFIIGYIDGDGSIILNKSKKQKAINLSMLGTLKIVTWIQNRFREILGEEINCIYKKKKQHEKNTFVLTLSDIRARKIFSHFYSIPVPKLERKWSEEKMNHCINYKKYRNKEKYIEILALENLGLNQAQIAKKMKITQAAISWYQKQELYQNLKKEADEAEAGEVDVETQESVTENKNV